MEWNGGLSAFRGIPCHHVIMREKELKKFRLTLFFPQDWLKSEKTKLYLFFTCLPQTMRLVCVCLKRICWADLSEAEKKSANNYFVFHSKRTNSFHLFTIPFPVKHKHVLFLRLRPVLPPFLRCKPAKRQHCWWWW